MNNFGKRMFILAGFGAGVAALLILTQVLLLNRNKPVPQPKSRAAQQALEKNTMRDESFSLPPAPPARPTPPPVRPQTQKEEKSPASVPIKETQKSSASLTDLFAAGEPDTSVTVEVGEVKKMLRDYIDQNRPDLRLSDSDYERLAQSLKMFREANQKMRTMERVSANSAAFRQSLQDMATATREFKQITGASPGEFFMGEEPPVRFGDDTTELEDDEIEPEYLPDQKP